MASDQTVPIVSLFCGPGGMDLGFRQAGFIPVLALDVNGTAVQTYNANNTGGVARRCDLIQLSEAQLLSMVVESCHGEVPRGVIGGPPCQAFSIGNIHKKRRDPRAGLGLVFAKLVHVLNDALGLDFVVFENVVGLGTQRHRHRFQRIQHALRRAGFNLFVKELDAATFGVPQHRRRLFIVGINREKFPWVRFDFPEGEVIVPTVRETIGHLPEPAFFHRGIRREDIPFHCNHWTMYPRSPKFRDNIHGNGRSFRRLAWDKPSLTVAYGNREIHVHPDGKRRLSVFEAMLLQGFPESYELYGSLSDQISQVCDAVPPALAQAIGVSIQRSLRRPIEALQSALLRWFGKNQRQFPWRQTNNPFQIVVAEKLLQQTTATDAVVAAYSQITTCYPDWKALACAPNGELRKIIEPLGFVYRAAELVVLAQHICEHHAGQIPRDLKALLTLPGVGDYCARAVLSFAFGEPWAIVDTNIARFLFRYFGLSFRLSQNPARDRRLHAIASAVLPSDNSRAFNLAVLDLCAAYCHNRRPGCSVCPVREGCSFCKAPGSIPTYSEREKRARHRR